MIPCKEYDEQVEKLDVDEIPLPRRKARKLSDPDHAEEFAKSANSAAREIK